MVPTALDIIFCEPEFKMKEIIIQIPARFF